MKQPSFSDLEYVKKKKTTRRERFLQEIDSIIPWGLLVRPIKRVYPQGHTGRPPVALESMLRIYFLQQWYGLSDPAAEDSLYDTESMHHFVGIDLDSIPDESTICRFRHHTIAAFPFHLIYLFGVSSLIKNVSPTAYFLSELIPQNIVISILDRYCWRLKAINSGFLCHNSDLAQCR